MNFFTKVESEKPVRINDIGRIMKYKSALICLLSEDQPRYEKGQLIQAKNESILVEIIECERWLKNNINKL